MALLQSCNSAGCAVQQVVFMPGGLTTDIKSLEANGSTVASAQAGDIVGFTVTAPAKFVRTCLCYKLL